MTDQGHDEVLTIHVREGQYLIEGSHGRVEDWPATEHGLTTGEDNWIAVLTGTRDGPVNVHIEMTGSAPGTVAAGWEMVGERDIVTSRGLIEIADPYHINGARLLRVSPGRYRVRIHVRGREPAAQFNFLDEPQETHLIQIWLTDAPASTIVLTGPDGLAEQL